MNFTTKITPRSPFVATTIRLSPIDNVMPRCYTRLLFGYHLQDGASSDICYKLLTALPTLLDVYPDLAGNIHTDPNNGSQSISITEESSVVIEMKTLDLAYHELTSMSNDLTPVGLFPSGDNPAAGTFQINVLKGGIIICICIHHAVSDISGLANVVSTWAYISRNGSNPPLPAGSLTRAALSNGLPDQSISSEVHPEYKFVDPAASESDATAPPPPVITECRAKIIRIPLVKLEQIQNSFHDNHTKEQRLSKNDLLMALIWRCVTRARVQAGLVPSTTLKSMLGFATNGRKILRPPLPREYLGNVNFFCPVVLPIEELASKEHELTNIASSIRSALSGMSDTRLKSAVAYLSSPPVSDHIDNIQPGFRTFCGSDFSVTSWRRMFDDYKQETDFGFGPANYARVPDAKFDGLAIVYPAPNDAEVFEVYMGLQKETWHFLKRDEEWLSLLA